MNNEVHFDQLTKRVDDTKIGNKTGRCSHTCQQEQRQSIQSKVGLLVGRNVKHVQHTISETNKANWIRHEYRKGNGNTANCGQWISVTVIVENIAITGTTKGQESCQGNANVDKSA